MDEQLKAECFDRFVAIVARKYKYHCVRHNEEETFEGLINYCINTDVIRERTVAHYMIMEIYPKALYEEGHYVRAYQRISDETGLSESTVRNQLKRPKRYGLKIR